MKKYLCLFLSLIMTLTLFTSCNKEEDTGKKEDKGSSVSKSEKDESTSTKPTSTPEEVKKDTVTAWLITKVDYGSSYSEYVYDDKGQPIKEIYTYTYEGEEHSNEYLHNYEFDDNGFVISEQSDAGGDFIEVYNDYGDLIEFMRYYLKEDGTKDIQQSHHYDYKYDENGNIVLIRANENYGDRENIYNVDFTYNKNGDLLTKTKRTVDGEITEGYCKYDNEGRLIHVSLFDHTFFNNYVTSYDYAYDNDGKMTKGIVVININYHSNHYIYAENIIYDEDGNFSVNDSYATHKFDKNGNLIEKENYAKFTYTPIEVTPARKKAIERYKWDIYYYSLQK